MIWMTWRQHRTETFVLSGVVAALGLILVVLGRPIYALFPDGAAVCADAALGGDDACSLALSKLSTQFDYVASLSLMLYAVPFLIGAFLGAPLLAREIESGTWQLAWTQAVPRLRWLTVKLSALAGLTVLLTLAFSAIISWYRYPLDVLDGRLGRVGFDVEGVVPVAHGLFAFALATAAGVLLRRSIGALAVALIVFVVVRVAVASLRPVFGSPSTTVEAVAANQDGVRIGTDNPADWVLDMTFKDAAGNTLDDAAWFKLVKATGDARQPLSEYLSAKGIQRSVTYHPGDRFWDFQLIEAGLFVGAAAMLVALVVWRVRRRGL